MYIVNIYHTQRAYRKGDLEYEVVLDGVRHFKTRKDAKAYIEGRLKGKQDVYRYYKKGDKTSFCQYNTGDSWIHENTGERIYESYRFELRKAKLG